MATATAVTPVERPGGNQHHFTFTLDPGSIAAGAREVQTVTIPGLAVGDVSSIPNPRTALAAGMVVGAPTCAANTLTFSIENQSAGTVDAASGIWDVMIFRGSTRPLR